MLRIENGDDVLEAFIVFAQQRTQLGFELDFLFQTLVAFHGFECGKLFGQMTFELTVFSKFGHWYPQAWIVIWIVDKNGKGIEEGFWRSTRIHATTK